MPFVHVAIRMSLAVSVLACTDARVPANGGADTTGGRPTAGTPASGIDTGNVTPGAALDSTASSPSDSTGLLGREWSLVALDGGIVAVPSGGQLPTLRLDMVEGRLTVIGNAGCNRFRGAPTMSDSTLRFGPLMATKMACPALELERRYLSALESTAAYRLAGRDLELLAGDRVVARFSSS